MTGMRDYLQYYFYTQIRKLTDFISDVICFNCADILGDCPSFEWPFNHYTLSNSIKTH